MNYKDILTALPDAVAESLQKNLDAIQFSEHLTNSQIQALIEGAVQETRTSVIIDDPEKRRLVHLVLSYVGDAGLRLLLA